MPSLSDFFHFDLAILMACAGIFSTSAFHVFARAYQTLNIVHKQWLSILPTSVLIAFTEAFVVVVVVTTTNLWVLLTWGVGGAAGCWAAMLLNRRTKR